MIKTLLKWSLVISKCPLSVLERCPSYREFGYSKMTDKRAGTITRCPSYGGVRLIEVSVKRELTVLPSGCMTVRKLHLFSYTDIFYQLTNLALKRT